MPRLQRTYLAPTAVSRNLTFPNGAPQQIQDKWRFLTINKESAQNVGDGEGIVTVSNRVKNRFPEMVAELGHLLGMAGGKKPSSSTRKRQDVILMAIRASYPCEAFVEITAFDVDQELL